MQVRMKSSPFRIVHDQPQARSPAAAGLVKRLRQVSPSDALPAIGPSAEDIRLYGPLGRTVPVPQIDPARFNPDPRLLDDFTPERALAEGVIPLRKLGQTLMVAVSDPAVIPKLPQLTGHQGMFLPHLVPFPMLEEKVLALRGATLASHAETRVPARESCRNWSVRPHMPLLCVLASLFCLALIAAPQVVLIALICWGLFWMVASAALKLMVLFTARTRPTVVLPPVATPLHQPIVTVIVALYREADTRKTASMSSLPLKMMTGSPAQHWQQLNFRHGRVWSSCPWAHCAPNRVP
jgi:glycosyltransferase XagB